MMPRHALIAAALFLAACAGHKTVAEFPPGSMSYAEINDCLAARFGVDPLYGQPRIWNMTRPDLVDTYGSEWGATVTRLFGPVAGEDMYLVEGMTAFQHNWVVTHETTHQFQERRLGLWDQSREANERHAVANQMAWRGCQ